jgi:hypothetical protein
MLIGIPSIAAFIFQLVYNSLSTRVKKERDVARRIRDGVQALLRDRLRQNYIAFKKKGHIDIADKENYHCLYLSYHELGGNGVVDEMHRKIMLLPISVQKDDDPLYKPKNTKNESKENN